VGRLKEDGLVLCMLSLSRSTCSSGEERNSMFHLAMANCCNFRLLHGLVLREVPKGSLHVLCNKRGQLSRFSSAELV
jgi:hypothetical protein